MIRSAVVFIYALALWVCSRSPDSLLIGEWTQPGLSFTAREIYRPDHTYCACLDHPRDGPFRSEGTWRIEGRLMICRDYQHGESRAEILALSRNELQIKGPDGIISTYVHLQ